jgi:hypothetical protein
MKTRWEHDNVFTIEDDEALMRQCLSLLTDFSQMENTDDLVFWELRKDEIMDSLCERLK